MKHLNGTNVFDRRLFLAGGAAALAGIPGLGKAQTSSQPPRLSVRIADFVTGFELKHAPQLATQKRRP